ncbi:MAG: hypothetical protein H0T79_06155 [Deltaproteobacteria bacterium]|nr:hypothetical protein [Deltaproteobacteria bacterium]
MQPNPLVSPNETLRKSEKITIITGDLDLQMPEEASGTQRASVARNHRYPLVNQASFTMVSRDRLRFHMQIDHKWEEWADLKTWDVDLVDDKGRHWIPESTEHPSVRLITKMWDREQRTARCDQRGRDGAGNCITTMGTYDDGWRNRQTLGNLSVFRGRADFVFYERDLFTPDMRWLKLTVHRAGQAFEFTWRFQELTATSD